MAQKGVNKVILVGNLGADPETRYTQGGSAITTIKIATSESWTDKQSGEKQERTEWHRVKFFGKLAEIAGEYLKKGRQVYVEGSLRTDKYTDKDGIERYTTDVIADQMQMLGGNPGGNSGGDESRGGDRQQGNARSGGGNQSRGQAPQGNRSGGQGNNRQNNSQNNTGGGYSAPFDDDEIPFDEAEH